jgi:hypothetical protein
MTLREKVLAGVVGGAVVLFGGTKAVHWAVLQPLESFNQELADAQRKKDNLTDFVEAHRDVAGQWQNHTERAFSADPDSAQAELAAEIVALLKYHHFAREYNIEKRSPRTGKSGLTEVSLRISAEGPLESVVGFMRDFYAKPYFARLSEVSLHSKAGKRARSGRPGSQMTDDDVTLSVGATAVTLSVGMTATTIVLPSLKGARPKPYNAMANAPARLKHGLKAYDEIAEVNFFQRYKPPKAIVSTPTTQEIVRVDPDPPSRPKPPRPDMRVVYVGTLNGEPVAYVVDDGHREVPAVKYRLNDEIDDGQLVLIHAKGIVVRVTDERGSSEEFEDYFCPRNTSFKERLPLAQADPDVVRQVPTQEPERGPPANAPRPSERPGR